MITVEQGSVVCRVDEKVKATVVTIVFHGGTRVNGVVQANGEKVVMTIKNPPDYRNFKVGDILDYRDGNHNNDKSFCVIRVDGPCKYELKEN